MYNKHTEVHLLDVIILNLMKKCTVNIPYNLLLVICETSLNYVLLKVRFSMYAHTPKRCLASGRYNSTFVS